MLALAKTAKWNIVSKHQIFKLFVVFYHHTVRQRSSLSCNWHKGCFSVHYSTQVHGCLLPHPFGTQFLNIFCTHRVVTQQHWMKRYTYTTKTTTRSEKMRPSKRRVVSHRETVTQNSKHMMMTMIIFWKMVWIGSLGMHKLGRLRATATATGPWSSKYWRLNMTAPK